jgi:levoglucosan dehydrogenase
VSAPEEVRIGIVGAGFIGDVHSAAYRAVAGIYPDAPRRVTLAVVADADAERGARLASAWGWERAERDWHAVTRADDVDVVDVCVPNALHAEIAIDALQHGKHVICEKPLAHDVASARAMCEAAEASGRLAQVCFYYRLWPAIAWARQLVERGEIGAISHFRGWMLQDYAAAAQHDLGWRQRRSDAGAGALGDLGSHISDIARYLCGEIVEVCATTRELVARPGGSTGIDDIVSMLVSFESGAGGVLEASWALRGHKCDLGFDLVGDAGAIRFSWERSNEIEVLTGDPADPMNGFRRILIGGGIQPDTARFSGVPGQGMGYRDAFTIGVGQLLRALETAETSVEPTFADGLRVGQIVAAAQESAQRRGFVRVATA